MSLYNFSDNSPWSDNKKRPEIFPSPEKRQKNKSGVKSAQLKDRFIPNKVSSNMYELLLSDKKINRQLNFDKEKVSPLQANNNYNNLLQQNNQQQSDQQQQQQQNDIDQEYNNLDLNNNLRHENQANTYAQMLKYNILSDHQDIENMGPMKQRIQEQENIDEKGEGQKSIDDKVFKYKKVQNRNSELILNYSPFKIVQAYQQQEQTPVRKINKQPYKILDAPNLKDDFYYNLLDWSAKNIITIGLGNGIYTWNAKTNQACKLAEFENLEVTSLNWSPQGILLASGDKSGAVKIFDTEKNKPVRSYSNHKHRVGVLSWNNNIITSGSRDSYIYLSDIRSSAKYITKFQGHKQEVCGCKWSYDENLLATGGNDNKAYAWNLKMGKQQSKFEHNAAIKALTWSPHSHSTLVTGGGTTDKMLKLWNVNTNKLLYQVNTGSQICNMGFTKNANEFVTTHGYSMNQVAVWKVGCRNSNYEQTNSSSIESVQKIATLYGHSYRVLYLAISPDGENIVTGSGDETLRFWKAFPASSSSSLYKKSSLDPLSLEIR